MGSTTSLGNIWPRYWFLAPTELVIETFALHLKKIQEGGIMHSLQIHYNMTTKKNHKQKAHSGFFSVSPACEKEKGDFKEIVCKKFHPDLGDD